MIGGGQEKKGHDKAVHRVAGLLAVLALIDAGCEGFRSRSWRG